MASLKSILIALALVTSVQGGYQFYDTDTCKQCINEGDTVCRSIDQEAYAYCLERSEVKSWRKSSFYCTSGASDPMNMFACPYLSSCGSRSSRFGFDVDERNSLDIKVDLDDDAVCYYQLLVDTSSLDTELNSYSWQIEFKSLIGVAPILAYGSGLNSISEEVADINESDTFEFVADENIVFLSLVGKEDNPSFFV